MNGLKHVSPEFELIVRSCRTAIDALAKPMAVKGLTALPVERMEGRAVPSAPLRHQDDLPADCGRIIELCRRHQVGPMVYRGLKHPRINDERPTSNVQRSKDATKGFQKIGR